MMLNEILEQIKNYDKIIIHRHVSPDPDAMGSQMGMFHIITENFPEKEVYVTGVFPEKLSYFKAHSKLKDSAFDNALIIVTDTANNERIDDDRWQNADYVIKIDHHPVVDDYGDINWVDSNKSSTSEMIYDFYNEFRDQLTLSKEAQELILAGIVADTNRFLFPSTTSSTFEVAAKMKQDEVDFKSVYDKLYRRTFTEMKYYGYILCNLVIEERVAYIILDSAAIKKNNVDIATSSNLIGELNNIEEFDVWVFVTEDKAHKNFRVNIRSRGPIINDVAANFGGGGHICASGVRMKKIEKVLELIEQLKTRVGEFNAK